MWGIRRGPANSPHKWPATREMLPFDDVIMCWYHRIDQSIIYYYWRLLYCLHLCVPGIYIYDQWMHWRMSAYWGYTYARALNAVLLIHWADSFRVLSFSFSSVLSFSFSYHYHWFVFQHFHDIIFIMKLRAQNKVDWKHTTINLGDLWYQPNALIDLPLT